MFPNIQVRYYCLILAVFMLVPVCSAQVERETLKKIDSLRAAGQWDEVIPLIETNYDKADNDRLRFTFNWILSLAFGQKNNHVNAAVALYRAVAINPKVGHAWGNLGWELYLLDKIDSALIASEKAIALDSTLSYALGNIGLIQLRKGKDVALKTYRRAGDILFDTGDFHTFEGIYGDIMKDKDKLQKNKKLFEQVVAYLDGMKDLIKQKSELDSK